MARFAFLLMSATALSSVAFAADFPSAKSQVVTPKEEGAWDGPYLGVNFGTALGTNNWTSPTGALLLDQTPRFPADSTQQGLFGGLTFGYNHQIGSWVIGAEADVDFTNIYGHAVCGGTFGEGGMGWACKSAPETLASLDARAGYAIGGGLLFFAKAGLAYAHDKLSIGAYSPDGFDASNPLVAGYQDRFGYTLGAGLEYALGGGWSAKAEFDFYGFAPRTFSGNDPLFATRYGATVNQNISVAKFGLNYRWGDDDSASPAPALLADLSGEFGARIGWGGGRYRFDLFDPIATSAMNSRLTWPGSGVMAEAFGRVDYDQTWFVKGILGGIALGDGGTMHDEDFPPALAPYSNTVSATKNGGDVYGVFDLGYAFHAPWARISPFVGFSYLEDRQNAYGCTQVATHPDICSQAGVAPPMVAADQLTLSRFDKWQALRLGVSGDAMLTDKIKLALEAAWLPYVAVNGSYDNHWLRPDINALADHGHGNGVQLEGVVSYTITDRISAGVGARYWAMSAKGAVLFPGGYPPSPTKVSVDRTMVFAQVSYAFGKIESPAPLSEQY